METKVCKGCGKELPATREYFYGRPDNKDGLNGKCKACVRFGPREEKEKLADGFKRCNKCETVFPSTEEYFRPKKNRAGDYILYYICRECEKQDKHDFKQEHKEEIAEYNASYRELHREYYLNYHKNYHKEHYEAKPRQKKVKEDIIKSNVKKNDQILKPEVEKRPVKKKEGDITSKNEKPKKAKKLKESIENKTKTIKKKKTKICSFCGNAFEYINKQQRYCSRKCYFDSKKEPKERLRQVSTIETREIDMRHVGGFCQSLKDAVLERDGRKCYICGKPTNLHVHHIIPRAHGGENVMDNLITLCGGCHRSVEAGNIENAVYKCVQRAVKNVGKY